MARSSLITNARSFQLAGVPDALHFGHEGLDFHLQGKHLSIGCDECHPDANTEFLTIGKKRFMGLEQRCTNCHRDVHQGGYGQDCDSCHGQQHPFPKVAEFVHTQAFQLAGAHGKATCNACHRPDSPSAIASLIAATRPASSDAMHVRSCRECHESPHNESFVAALATELNLSPDQSCQHCHPVEDETFVGSKVMLESDLHAHTGFTLHTPHDRLQCVSCHAGFGQPKSQLASFRQSFPGREPDDCKACHRDPHQGQFDDGPFRGADCLSCHSRHMFEPAAFTIEHHITYAVPSARRTCKGRLQSLSQAFHGAAIDPASEFRVALPRADSSRSGPTDLGPRFSWHVNVMQGLPRRPPRWPV